MDDRDYVSGLWADDWDSPEDSLYDALLLEIERGWVKLDSARVVREARIRRGVGLETKRRPT